MDGTLVGGKNAATHGLGRVARSCVIRASVLAPRPGWLTSILSLQENSDPHPFAGPERSEEGGWPENFGGEMAASGSGT
jgi:hypothetical protein